MSDSEGIMFRGVRLDAYTPSGAYTPDDMADFLKRFQLHEALKLIGQLSQEWFLRKKAATIRVGVSPLATTFWHTSRCG